MLTKLKSFFYRGKDTLFHKVAVSESGASVYVLYFLLAASVFVMLNISLSIVLFGVLLDYMDVYAVLMIAYLLLFLLTFLFRKRILRALQSFIKYCLVKS